MVIHSDLGKKKSCRLDYLTVVSQTRIYSPARVSPRTGFRYVCVGEVGTTHIDRKYHVQLYYEYIHFLNY